MRWDNPRTTSRSSPYCVESEAYHLALVLCAPQQGNRRVVAPAQVCQAQEVVFVADDAVEVCADRSARCPADVEVCLAPYAYVDVTGPTALDPARVLALVVQVVAAAGTVPLPLPIPGGAHAVAYEPAVAATHAAVVVAAVSAVMRVVR